MHAHCLAGIFSALSLLCSWDTYNVIELLSVNSKLLSTFIFILLLTVVRVIITLMKFKYCIDIYYLCHSPFIKHSLMLWKNASKFAFYICRKTHEFFSAFHFMQLWVLPYECHEAFLLSIKLSTRFLLLKSLL